jgi:hypothetical protein
MHDAELLALLDGYISDATELNASDRSQKRELALDFYDGKSDIPIEENKSSVVSNDLADALEWIKPSLQRIFMGSEHVASYEPRTEEDEENAKQATDVINYVFLREMDGFRVLNDAFHDGLLHGNGILKHRWHGEPQYKTERLTGLTEQDYFALLDDDTVEEVIEKREYLVGPDGEEIKTEDEGSGATNPSGRGNPEGEPDSKTAAGYA